MFGYIQFSEDYFAIITAICRGLKEQVPDLELGGIAIRRRTVCAKVEAVAEELNITSCEWWNQAERRILEQPYDPAKIRECLDRFGSEKLRFIITSDRDLSPGYVSGATTCGSRFGDLVNRSDEQRWSYVVGLLDYFTRAFETKRPDFVFLNEITFAWEAAMFLAAERLDIPCLSLAYMRGSRGYCITTDIYGKVPAARELYLRSLAQPALLEPFLPEARKQIDDFRNRPVPPDYLAANRKNFARQISLTGMFRRLLTDLAIIAAVKLKRCGTAGVLRQCDPVNWLKLGLRLHRVGRRADRCKLFEPAAPYLDGNYIFYPLHYEPESSTSVASHLMTNQLAVIEQLSKNMPFGFRLLVKEHLPSLGMRPRGFYERIRGLPDVHLISPFENTFMLERKARLIVVLTGSAGWEGIILGVPVMIFGHADYAEIGAGFTECHELIDLAGEIETALHTPPATDRELTHFIAAQMALKTELRTTDLTAKFDGRECDLRHLEGCGRQLAEQILAAARSGREEKGVTAP